MEATIFRGIERLLIAFGAVFLCYLGYKLFMNGLDKGTGKLQFKSKFMEVVFSGTGPGLFFMAFGAIIMLTLILNGTTFVEGTNEIRYSPRAERNLEKLTKKLPIQKIDSEESKKNSPLQPKPDNGNKMETIPSSRSNLSCSTCASASMDGIVVEKNNSIYVKNCEYNPTHPGICR